MWRNWVWLPGPAVRAGTTTNIGHVFQRHVRRPGADDARRQPGPQEPLPGDGGLLRRAPLAPCRPEREARGGLAVADGNAGEREELRRRCVIGVVRAACAQAGGDTPNAGRLL